MTVRFPVFFSFPSGIRKNVQPDVIFPTDQKDYLQRRIKCDFLKNVFSY